MQDIIEMTMRQMGIKRENRIMDVAGNNNSSRKEVVIYPHAYDDEYVSSPRGVFEVPITGTDSDSSGITVWSPGKSPNTGVPKLSGKDSGQQWKAMIDALRFKNVRRFSTIPLLAASYEISRRNLRKKLARLTTGDDDEDYGIDLDGIPTKPSWKNFSFAELSAATDNFNPS